MEATLDANGTATLYFPPGTYLVKNKLSLVQGSNPWNSLTIKGESASVSTIRTDVQNSGIFDLQFSSQVPVVIKNMRLVADKPDAGIAVSIAMPPSATAPIATTPRSLVVDNVIITGNERSDTDYFYNSIKGSGLTKPLFKDVQMRGLVRGDDDTLNFTSMHIGACVYLRDGWGVTLDGQFTGCNRMGAGLDIEQKGGVVDINAKSFGVAVNTGVRIRANGGTVRSISTHAKAFLWNYDIANADAVTIAGTEFLNNDFSTSTDRGSIKIVNSKNITIKENMFERTKTNNPNRRTILIGQGNSNVRIVDNHFDEAGVGIEVTSGIIGTKILDNRFIKVSTDIINNGISTIIRKLPPLLPLPI